ncbi:tRNA (guanine-N(7)-)-methyltransferase [Linum perenne]
MAAAKLALLSPSLSSFSKYSANFRRFSVKVNACFDATKQLTSPNLVTLEYADLNLPSALQDVGHVRLRQHVNPLSSSFSMPAPVPNWKEVFRDPTLPLMVDIGSGSGRFLMWLAKRNPDSGNYLGLEIREKVWRNKP